MPCTWVAFYQSHPAIILSTYTMCLYENSTSKWIALRCPVYKTCACQSLTTTYTRSQYDYSIHSQLTHVKTCQKCVYSYWTSHATVYKWFNTRRYDEHYAGAIHCVEDHARYGIIVQHSSLNWSGGVKFGAFFWWGSPSESRLCKQLKVKTCLSTLIYFARLQRAIDPYTESDNGNKSHTSDTILILSSRQTHDVSTLGWRHDPGMTSRPWVASESGPATLSRYIQDKIRINSSVWKLSS